jgi:hypothetical protein
LNKSYKIARRESKASAMRVLPGTGLMASGLGPGTTKSDFTGKEAAALL